MTNEASLPPGSSGNSWPQSGPSSMHKALDAKSVSLEEGLVDSACREFTTSDEAEQAAAGQLR